jgi:hypothetical protein
MPAKVAEIVSQGRVEGFPFESRLPNPSRTAILKIINDNVSVRYNHRQLARREAASWGSRLLPRASVPPEAQEPFVGAALAQPPSRDTTPRAHRGR